MARVVLVEALRPPVGEPSFWATQAFVLCLAALHFYLDAVVKLATTAFPTGSPVALLLIPVLYSALRHGLAGSAATAFLATVLWLPDLALPGALGHPANDLSDLAIVDGVAIFVGIHIQRRLIQRRLAEAVEAEVRSYAGLLLAAQEEERRRIAHEIHDDPLQQLIHLARRMDSLPEQFVQNPAFATLRDIRVELLAVIGHLREVAGGLMPPGLDQLGLVAAVRGLVADIGELENVRADLDVTGPAVRLAPDAELGAFRIIQEAVRNASRHASAQALRVGLHYDAEELRICVVDDGVGFDPISAGHGTLVHLGLVGMRERATMLGGRLAVSSRRRAGTTIEARLPIHRDSGITVVPQRGSTLAEP
jgi:signal transduction histidine kinase